MWGDGCVRCIGVDGKLQGVDGADGDIAGLFVFVVVLVLIGGGAGLISSATFVKGLEVSLELIDCCCCWAVRELVFVDVCGALLG